MTDDPTTAWPRNCYFGEPWDAPITDEIERVPTPVGEKCLHCPDAIAEGDQGLTMLHIGLGDDGQPARSIRPVHRECHLRSLFGALFPSAPEAQKAGEPDPAAWRREGLTVLDWIERRRPS